MVIETKEVQMNKQDLLNKLKYLRKFGGNVLCVGSKLHMSQIVENFFLGSNSTFVDMASNTVEAKEKLLEQLSYDLVFCSPQLERSDSGLYLMDLVEETHPYAQFVLVSDLDVYEDLNLEPNQFFLHTGNVECFTRKLTA